MFSQLMRIFKMWPGGESLRSILQPMCDGRDTGNIILSHLYLLAGFSLPLWLSPLRQYNTGEYTHIKQPVLCYYNVPCINKVLKLSLYSGALALGVGDSVAAVSGQLMGTLKWPGQSISHLLYCMYVYVVTMTVWLYVLCV